MTAEAATLTDRAVLQSKGTTLFSHLQLCDFGMQERGSAVIHNQFSMTCFNQTEGMKIPRESEEIFFLKLFPKQIRRDKHHWLSAFTFSSMWGKTAKCSI